MGTKAVDEIKVGKTYWHVNTNHELFMVKVIEVADRTVAVRCGDTLFVCTPETLHPSENAALVAALKKCREALRDANWRASFNCSPIGRRNYY